MRKSSARGEPDLSALDILISDFVRVSSFVISHFRRLLPPDLLFKQLRNAMLGKINLAGVRAQGAPNSWHGPLLNHAEVEQLVMLRVDLFLDVCHGGVEQVPL